MVRDSNDIMAIVDPGRPGVREPGDRAHPRARHRAAHRQRRVRPHPSRRPGDQLVAGSSGPREGKMDRVEVRLRRGDGTWHVVEAVATNLLDDPSVEGIVISAHDLADTGTPRPNSARRGAVPEPRSSTLRSAWHSSRSTADSSVSTARSCRSSATESRAPSRRRCSTSVAGEDHGPYHEQVRRLFAGVTQSAQLEQRLVHHDGHPVWVSLGRRAAGPRREGRTHVPGVPGRGHR